MSTTYSTRNIGQLGLGISVVLLLVHLYYFEYRLFEHWGWTGAAGDYVLGKIAGTGLFFHPNRSKLIALSFVALSTLSSRGRKNEKISPIGVWAWVLCGLMFYFVSGPLLLQVPGADFVTLGVVYLALTAAGFLMVVRGSARLSRLLQLPWSRDDRFGTRVRGFPQEERRLQSEFGLYLKSRYMYQGKQRESVINLINPRRGILIMGSPGSGKSWLIIEPLMRQLIEKGYAMFVYDFKFDSLSKLAWRYFQANRSRYSISAGFYCINFSDLSRSNRCNVLHWWTLDWLSDALGASRAILLSLNKDWIHRQGEFFVESPINFVAALIWYLRQYEDARFCTLPHVIELAQVPYDQLFAILKTQPEIRSLINPFIEAYEHKTMEMVDGQIASARVPLGRLASPDLYYILTGNDFSLRINGGAGSAIFCLGGDPSRQEALAPVLSLFIDRLCRLINQRSGNPCALVCDEFATVRAYSMTSTIATARSNNIIPILAVQDLSQLRTQYSREEADLFMNISGNLLCGQVGGETAKWVSERFPKILQEKTSVSNNSADTSVTTSIQWEETVTPATIATLSSGEFVGVVADDPDKEIELKAFHARLVAEERVADGSELPVVRKVGKEEVMENFDKVRADILRLVGDVVGRVMEANSRLLN
jgi:hypothetical protein